MFESLPGFDAYFPRREVNLHCPTAVEKPAIVTKRPLTDAISQPVQAPGRQWIFVRLVKVAVGADDIQPCERRLPGRGVKNCQAQRAVQRRVSHRRLALQRRARGAVNLFFAGLWIIGGDRQATPPRGAKTDCRRQNARQDPRGRLHEGIVATAAAGVYWWPINSKSDSRFQTCRDAVNLVKQTGVGEHGVTQNDASGETARVRQRKSFPGKPHAQSRDSRGNRVYGPRTDQDSAAQSAGADHCRHDAAGRRTADSYDSPEPVWPARSEM